jgi:hypothetical protein
MAKQPKPKATPAEFIKNLPYDYIMCREIHRWDDPYDQDLVVNSRAYVVQFTRFRRCGRCGYTTWVIYSVPDMRRIKHGNSYPKDFCAKGLGRISRDDVRLESLLRKGIKVAKR